MKKFFCGLLIALVLLQISEFSYSMDLMDAYYAALQNDPTFKRQLGEYLENREATAISRAALLPQIFFTSNLNRERLGEFHHYKDFGTYDMDISLSQTIFDAAAFQNLARAHAVVKQAAYTLAANQQDLILRVAIAYFEVLRAEDILRFTRLQIKANEEQIAIIEERLKAGHATITDYDQAKARLDSISARAVREKIDVYNRKQDLRQIIRIPIGKLARLKDVFPLAPPAPNDQQRWVHAAIEQNLSLLASRYAIIAAQDFIKETQAGHLPTVSLEGDYINFRDPAISPGGLTTNRKIEQYIGSLNFTLPVLQGGLVVAQSKAAIAAYEQTVATMIQIYESTLADARNAYVGINLGIQEVKESREAVKSNQNAYNHTLESYTYGQETTIDVLTQQNALFDAERTYATNRYLYLLNLIRLEQAAGTLKPLDLMVINRWLTNQPYPKYKGDYRVQTKDS